MSSTLILVPTSLEMELLSPILALSSRDDCAVELCGFGVIAAAARTAQLLSLYKPKRVILVGIAGALGELFTIGSAYGYDEVACFGIGVGSGASHLSTGEMGWQHFGEIGDVISFRGTATSPNANRQLLTVCSASADLDEAVIRSQSFPKACAEDMEGFAVALACHINGVPLQVIRGISNIAGERDKSNWKIERALHAAGELTRETLASI